jgi:hypothetical protein
MRYDEETQQYELDVRVLLARLGDLRDGLAATRPIVPADKQAVFDAVMAAIDPVVDAAEKEDAVGLKVAEQVIAMANKIRSAVNPGAAPAATAEGGDLF